MYCGLVIIFVLLLAGHATPAPATSLKVTIDDYKFSISHLGEFTLSGITKWPFLTVRKNGAIDIRNGNYQHSQQSSSISLPITSVATTTSRPILLLLLSLHQIRLEKVGIPAC